MTVNPSGWRPSTPANEQGQATTVTGNRALMLERLQQLLNCALQL